MPIIPTMPFFTPAPAPAAAPAPAPTPFAAPPTPTISMGSRAPTSKQPTTATTVIKSVPVVGTMFTFMFGDESSEDKRVTAEADDALSSIEGE